MRDAGIAQHEVGVDLAPGADAVAVGTGAERRVEGELPRLELGEREAADRAGEALGEHDRLALRRAASVPDHLDDAVGGLERGLDRVVEPRAVVGAHHQPVHHDRDVVVLAPVERRDLGQVVGLAVHPDADEAALAHVVEQVAELALAAAHDRREHLDPGLRRPARAPCR